MPYLRRSVAAARRIGNRTIAGLAGLSAVSVEARVGDPLQALSQYGDLIDHWDREGAWNMQMDDPAHPHRAARSRRP